MLTVIVPAFNCRDTIRQTLDSVVHGNRDSVAGIVVVDDGSVDGTAQTLSEYDACGVPLTVLTHPANRGGAAARNTAMNAVQTPFAFCLDSDNILVPGSLAVLHMFAIEVQADVASFRELHFFKRKTRAITHRWRFKEGTILLQDYLSGAVVPGASGNYLFRCSTWRDVGGYPEGASMLDTWGFGLRTVAHGKRMVVMPHGHYFHRYGHASYWVREHDANRTSRIARELLAPFEAQLHPGALAYIDGRVDWFEHLDRHPLATRNGHAGEPGHVLRPRGLARLASLARGLLR